MIPEVRTTDSSSMPGKRIKSLVPIIFVSTSRVTNMLEKKTYRFRCGSVGLGSRGGISVLGRTGFTLLLSLILGVFLHNDLSACQDTYCVSIDSYALTPFFQKIVQFFP